MKLYFQLCFFCLNILSLVINAPYTQDNSAWNINFNPNGENPSEYFGKWDGHTYYPSPDDWRKESIYQFVTDRFADGNPSNNEGKYGGYNLYDVGSRHGGDFKGIMNKIDYIKSLGYSAIWISPIFINMENSYHGYAQIDFTLLEERFGTLQEFRDLIDACHKLDIKVIVDIVVNHMADLFYFEGHPNEAAPFRLHEGEYRLLWRNESRQYTDFKIDNIFFPKGKYCDVYSADGVRNSDTGEGSFWFSDFHHNGDLRDYGDTWENTLGKIYGLMDDLRTTHPRVQDKIIAMTKALISSADIDGIRMDTPMQVPLEFFKRWVPAVKNHAALLGKKNFFIFGEFFCSKEKASTMTGRGKTKEMYGKDAFIDDVYTMDGGIHYPLYQWFIESIKNQNHNVNGLINLYNSDYNSYDFWNPERSQFEYKHVHFYDNHDQWRMSYSPDGFLKTDLSSAIIALWPGIPAFYYGDEQGFMTGNTALDGWSREDFMTSLAWRNLKTIDERNPADGDSFDMTNPHYLWVQKIMNVRRNYIALQVCDNVYEMWVQSGATNGIFAFMRMCSSNSDEWVLVIFNTWKDNLNINNMKTNWSHEEELINVLDEKETHTLSTGGYMENMNINGYGIKVFVKRSGFKELDLTVKSITPKHDQAIYKTSVNPNIDVTITFSDNINKSQILKGVRFNSKSVSSSMIKFPSDNTIVLTVSPIEGVNLIDISSQDILSLNGKKLYGNFRSRFRYGFDNNIIVNNDFTEDSKMVIAHSNKSITLSHKAIGAEKMRVLLKTSEDGKNDKWSDWVNFKNISTHIISDLAQTVIEVLVQYYVDNSAAYYVRQKLNSITFLQ